MNEEATMSGRGKNGRQDSTGEASCIPISINSCMFSLRINCWL